MEFLIDDKLSYSWIDSLYNIELAFDTLLKEF